MALIFKRPWTSQPQVALPVRPELRPIGGIQPGAFGTVDTSSQPLVIGTGITRAGGALDFSAANTGLTRTVAAEYPLTLVFRGSVRGSTARVVSSIATAADKTVRVYGIDGAAAAQHIGGTTNTAATTAAFWSFGRIFTCVAVFESAAMVRIYGAGNTGRVSAASTVNIGALVPMTKLSFGVYDGSAKTLPQDGLTEIAQWLNYAPSAAEAWSWVDNPWQLFAPLPRKIWAPDAAAGGNTIAVPAGALTLSGLVPTVTASTNYVSVPAGALSLSAFAPTVSATTNYVSVPAGSLSLLAYAPTVTASTHYVSVPAGALTITGYAPAVSNGAASSFIRYFDVLSGNILILRAL